MKWRYSWLTVLLLLLAALLLAGCEELEGLGAGTPGPADEQTPGATAEVTGTVTATETITGEEGEESLGTPPEQFTLDDYDGLQNLNSYEATSVLTQTTEEDEAAVTAVSRVARGEALPAIGAAEADELRHITVRREPAEGDEEPLELVTSDGDTWVRRDGDWSQSEASPETLVADTRWIGGATEADALLLLDPLALREMDILADAGEAEFVGEETVAGMRTWHYRYPSLDLSTALADSGAFAGLSDGEADLWVTPTFGIVVRSLVRGEGEVGSVLLERTISGINETFSVDLPPELQAEAMPGATETITDTEGITDTEDVTDTDGITDGAGIGAAAATLLAGELADPQEVNALRATTTITLTLDDVERAYEVLREVNTETMAEHLVITVTEDADPRAVEYITAEGLTVARLAGPADDLWREVDLTTEEILSNIPWSGTLFELLLPDAEGELESEEELEGRDTWVYRYDQEDLDASLLLELSEAQADVWVDAEEQRPVRLELTASGVDLFGRNFQVERATVWATEEEGIDIVLPPPFSEGPLPEEDETPAEAETPEETATPRRTRTPEETATPRGTRTPTATETLTDTDELTGTDVLTETEDEDRTPTRRPTPSDNETPEPAATARPTPEDEVEPDGGLAGVPAILADNDVPLPSNATGLQTIGNVVVYQVAQTPQEVIAFYTDEMEAAGYELAPSATAPRQAEAISRNATFRRDGTSVLVVAVSRGAQLSSVVVTVNVG